MAEHSRRRVVVQGSVSVSQAQEEARAGVGAADERVVASLEQLELPALPVAAQGLQCFAEDVILDGKDVLEERSFGAEAAPGLYVAQRGVFIGAHGHPVGADVLEALEDGQIRGQLDAHRDGIDQKADDGLGAVDRRMAAGASGTEQHVVLAAISGEEHGPGHLDEGAQRHVVAGSEGAESLGVFAGEKAVVEAAARGVFAGLGARRREIEPGGVLEAFEELQPEVFCE